jgi:acetate kinase
MDPAIIPWLMAMEELTLHQMNTMLNKHSGLYGVSGVSSDMREVLEARARGRRRADVAFRMFCYRVKKYIGAYAAAMGGVDAVFMTGGIGENSPDVREYSLSGLEFMGLELDLGRNAELKGREVRSRPRARGSRPGWSRPTRRRRSPATCARARRRHADLRAARSPQLARVSQRPPDRGR